MKRIIRVLITPCACLFLLLFIACAAIGGETPAFLTVGKTYKIIPQGTIFKVVEKGTEGWIKADVSGIGGGIMWLNTLRMTAVKAVR